MQARDKWKINDLNTPTDKTLTDLQSSLVSAMVGFTGSQSNILQSTSPQKSYHVNTQLTDYRPL